MTITPLRRALGSHLGKTLTPELAASIEVMVMAPNDASHDPVKFGHVEHNGYHIQAERFVEIAEEMHLLHLEHWQETEKHRHGLSMNPDYLGLIARERAGNLIQFTLRANSGELVGNLRMFLATSMHTQTRYACEDTLFIKPAHRGGFAVMALMRFAEDALRSIGITEIRVNSKLVNSADVLMRRMKYQPVALEFVKFFHQE